MNKRHNILSRPAVNSVGNFDERTTARTVPSLLIASNVWPNSSQNL